MKTVKFTHFIHKYGSILKNLNEGIMITRDNKPYFMLTKPEQKEPSFRCSRGAWMGRMAIDADNARKLVREISDSRDAQPRRPDRTARLKTADDYLHPEASATAPWLRGVLESRRERRIFRREASPRALKATHLVDHGIAELVGHRNPTPCDYDHSVLIHVKSRFLKSQ